MKDYLIFSLIIVLLLGGCAGLENRENITEVCFVYWNGANEVVDVCVSSGKREDPYIQDGQVGNLVDYTLICVTPLTNKILDSNCTAFIDGKEYCIELQKSPYQNTYACDLGISTDKKAKINIKLSFNGESQTINLENLSDSFEIDYREAIKIFYTQFLDVKVSKEGGELYCKVIASPLHSNLRFWYVRLLYESGEDRVCVIDPQTGKVLAHK
ncbi:MAG: hypothetical protein IKQ31_00215 [Clostridia bacterium]|nr:hypothetical protein [Clostridia bacterium]